MIPDHDYKSLFARKDMVLDLIEHILPKGLFSGAEQDTLSPFKSSYIADFPQSKDRHSDLVWKIRVKGRWMYVYLLLEFQTTVDKQMPWRIMTYLGLLYQEISENLNPGEPLPFIFPLVIYSGSSPRWHASTDTLGMFEEVPEAWQPFIPQLQYHLIDQGAVAVESWFNTENSLAALIFVLESATHPEDLRKVLRKLLHFQQQGRLDVIKMALMRMAKRVFDRKFANMADEFWNDLKGVVEIMSTQLEDMVAYVEERGSRETAAAMLQSFLCQRFGSLPEWAREKLQAADSAQLKAWGDRFFAARSLEDLLDPK